MADRDVEEVADAAADGLPPAFAIKVAPHASACWLWQGYINPDGYGRFWFDGMQWQAHRFAYVALVGQIPHGLTLDHLCRVRHCVNPEHLEPVTRAENVMRGETLSARNAIKTHCYRGHEFTPRNTMLDVANGWRRCRECKRQWEQVNRPHIARGAP